MSTDLPYYLSFSVFPGIGPVRFSLLVNYFGSAKSAWEASSQELVHIGLPKPIVERFSLFRKTFDVEEYLSQLDKRHIRLLLESDPAYPKQLRAISDHPFLLYIVGEAPLSLLSSRRMMGVVGTRKMTPYGREVTRRITADLVRNNFVIVSGLALGVDGVAHETTLENHGQTIAVLGCGVDIIAPSSHANLYYAIQKNGGLIISEMPLGHRPEKGLFPARNRIISGLSLGVLVTEGAEDSGALITASNAGEQGREVFAVPGPITSAYSNGPATLLKHGARLVQGVGDILEELNLSQSTLPPAIDVSQLTKTGQAIVALLEELPLHINDIVEKSGLTTDAVLSEVTTLELAGIVSCSTDGEYALTK